MKMVKKDFHGFRITLFTFFSGPKILTPLLMSTVNKYTVL